MKTWTWTAAACALVAAYVVARAVLVPFTYDEAASYLRYLSRDFGSVFSFEVATNHFLNTLLTKVVSLVAGNGELALRFASLLGFGVYLYFIIRILGDVTNGLRRVAGFVLLTFNPYLLDYFAMSRGYGMSIGFLMGALFYLLRFGSDATTADGRRDLSRALAFGCVAVLANFSLLDAYLGLIAVVLAHFVAVRRAEQSPPVRSSGWRRLVLPVVAAIFIFLVFAQDPHLSAQLYDPITVNIAGVTPAEADGVRVFGVGLRHRSYPLTRSAAAEWRGAPGPVEYVLIEFPAAVADKVDAENSLIMTAIGGGQFAYRRGSAEVSTWGTPDGKTLYQIRPPLSPAGLRLAPHLPVINWSGERTHLTIVAKATGIALATLAALGVALWTVGWILTRARLVTASGWRVLVTGILWLAAVAGVPLYLLRRDRQLYFGGHQGIVDDTFYSLIDDSFYGRTYFASQREVVFGAVVTTMMAFIVVLAWSYRRKPALVMRASYLLLVLVVAAAAVIAQHREFGTPFLIGRTSLFFIPLFMLFAVFAGETIAALGRAGRAIATSLIVTAATLATLHIALTANVSYAFDFKADAGTKAMMHDVGWVIANEGGAGSRIILAVEPTYTAVAAYYAQRARTATIEIDAIPTPRTADFLYVDEDNAASLRVIKKYPIAHTVLGRPSP